MSPTTMPSIPAEKAISLALEHHQAGRLAEAEALYREILSRFPDHGPALHLLGVLACQAGRPDAAIALIGRAAAIEPGSGEYQSNLGEAYRRSGRWGEAMACFRRAIALTPQLPAAHNGLGIVLKRAGQHDEAIHAFERAIALNPAYAEAFNNLGNACKDRARLDDAITAYRRAIALKPDYAEALNNLGNALRNQHRLAEASEAFRRAIAVRPGYPEAHNNLANVLMDQGQWEEAIALLRRAITLRPRYVEAHNNLGLALHESGRVDEALSVLAQTVELDPNLAAAHINLGAVLHSAGRLDQAAAAHQRALVLGSDPAEIHVALAGILRDAGRLDEACATLTQAIALDPDRAEPHVSLGRVLKDQGRLNEARASFRRALAIQPDHAEAASSLLFLAHLDPDRDAASLLAEHRRWAMGHAAPLAAEIRPHTNDRSPDRTLRIGFVSPDFRGHPVGRLLIPLFAHHDRRQTEFIAFSDVRRPDEVTRALAAHADGWRSILGQGNALVAEGIRHDRIDILVDLAQHTPGNRLLVFARKPAPVQVSMLGMPTTTGLSTIDYRLTDPHLDPPGSGDDDYAEASIRLPHSFWCYLPPHDSPPVAPVSPAERNGFVTLGCLHQFAKVSLPALRLWASILQKLPEAHLVLHAPAGTAREGVRAFFQDTGIEPERIEFDARVTLRDYLLRYHDIDLCLDSFPYGGGTTTMDALWMGVPVVTLAGRTAVGRGGVSILSNVGLAELIARTPEEYVALAAAWASDRTRLAALRAELRPRMQASPLMDGRTYAADIENALRQAWKRWCKA